jgi:hypothetical protein
MRKEISNIVFTKNRPLQLDGYLTSLYKHFPQKLLQTYIIYKPELFDNEYQQLFQEHPNCAVIREEDFSRDFLAVLSQVNTKYILFGVDDVVYFDTVDINVIDETFSQFAKDIFGFSLRLGRERLKAGNDRIGQASVAGQTVYSIDWRQGRTPTTRYPFELCATVLKTELVKRIISSSRNNNALLEKAFAPNSAVVNMLSVIFKRHSILKRFGYFYNPNTLESWNCRWCQRNHSLLPTRLFFQKLCASAIQVNMVNVTDRKTLDASKEDAIETLAQKYHQGYRLDIGFVRNNKPTDTHSGGEHFKLIQKQKISTCRGR